LYHNLEQPLEQPLVLPLPEQELPLEWELPLVPLPELPLER
jgi:hypothetical protein